MLAPITAFWDRLISIEVTRPTPEPRKIRWILGISGIVASLLLLAMLAIPYRGPGSFAPSILSLFLHVIRALLLITQSFWILWYSPWRPTSPLEQRQGRITALLCVIVLVLNSTAFIISYNPIRFTLHFFVLWCTIQLLLIQILWLIRRGLVQVGAMLIVFLAIASLLATGARSTLLLSSINIFAYVAVILCAALLIRWWAGLLIALTLPPLEAFFQIVGLLPGQPIWADVFTMAVLLGSVASIVALYAYSLGSSLTLLEKQRADLTFTNEELQRALKTAHEASTLKSQFVATVSHELRTPLTTVMGYTDMLRTGIYGPLTSEQQGALQRVTKSSEDLLQLISNMLDFSKIETGEQMLQERNVMLVDLIDEVVATYLPMAHAKGLVLQASIDSALPVAFYTDRLYIQQILSHLLSNAVKFTDRGAITLAVKQLAESYDSRKSQTIHLITFEVADTGVGITPEHQLLIFEAFRQIVPHHTMSRAGAGLGLAIVQRMVMLMDGIISVESTSGVGSTFTVKLPLKPAVDDALLARELEIRE